MLFVKTLLIMVQHVPLIGLPYCYIVDEGVHVSFGISGSSSFILYVSQEHDYVQMHDTKDRGPTSIENLNRGIYWLHNNDQRRW